jgi:hypothetical protein
MLSWTDEANDGRKGGLGLVISYHYNNHHHHHHHHLRQIIFYNAQYMSSKGLVLEWSSLHSAVVV